MPKTQCPKCEKSQKSELLDVLSHRRRGLRRNDYGFTYIVAGRLNKGKRARSERELTMDLYETFGMRK